MWWHETCFFSALVIEAEPFSWECQSECVSIFQRLFSKLSGWPCWRIIYCFKKRLKNFTNLVHASSNLTFVLIYFFLCNTHCDTGHNFTQLHLYWFFWLNTCTIGWNNVWIIRTTFGHLHNQKIHKYTLRIQGFSMR